MIAFGVAPGIKSLAYCALEWDGAGPAIVLDQDVMSRSRLVRGNPPAGMLRKKFHCHQLILSTVIERYQISALAIGPQADQTEPPLNAQIATTVLLECGRLLGVTVVRVERPALEQAFQFGKRRTLRKALREHIDGPLPNDQRGVLALAAAVYATDCRLIRSAG